MRALELNACKRNVIRVKAVRNAVAKFREVVSQRLLTGGTMRLAAGLVHLLVPHCDVSVVNWPCLCSILVLLLQERLSKEPNSEIAQCCKDYPNPGSNQVPNRLTVLPDEELAGRHDYREEKRNADKPTETQPARHEASLLPTFPLCDDKTWSYCRSTCPRGLPVV